MPVIPIISQLSAIHRSGDSTVGLVNGKPNLQSHTMIIISAHGESYSTAAASIALLCTGIRNYQSQGQTNLFARHKLGLHIIGIVTILLRIFRSFAIRSEQLRFKVGPQCTISTKFLSPIELLMRPSPELAAGSQSWWVGERRLQDTHLGSSAPLCCRTDRIDSARSSSSSL